MSHRRVKRKEVWAQGRKQITEFMKMCKGRCEKAKRTGNERSIGEQEEMGGKEGEEEEKVKRRRRRRRKVPNKSHQSMNFHGYQLA